MRQPCNVAQGGLGYVKRASPGDVTDFIGEMKFLREALGRSLFFGTGSSDPKNRAIRQGLG